MKYSLYIALKYLKPQKDKFFSYLSLVISVLGIAVGVCTLIVTLGIMTGFHKEIKQRLSEIYPHIVITSLHNIDSKFLENEKEVASYSPFIYSQAILKFNDRVYTAVVKCIDYKKEISVVNIHKVIKWFNKDGLDKNSIVLGKELAKNLGIVGNEEIIMVLPTQIQTPFGNLPLTEKFIVKGIMSTGVYEYDNNLCLIDYSLASKIFVDPQTKQLNGVKGLGIKVKNEEKIELVVKKLKQQLGPFVKVLSWMQLNYNLFSALKLEKIMMIIIVSLIIIVACFMIMSNLLLKGIQKSKDIGIMMAIGVSKYTIRKIFFLQGMIINISGIVLGSLLGFFLGFLIKEYQFIKLPKGVYYIDKIPVYFSILDIFITLSITILAGIVASVYPAHRISQFDPVEIIRYG